MEDMDPELLGVVQDELSWYRDRTFLSQAIKEVARDALVDVVAESIRVHHADMLLSALRDDVFMAFKPEEGRKLLQRDDRHALLKEATHRAVRLEIKRRLEMPDSVDQLELPW